MPSMSRPPPQFNGPPIPERSTSPSTGGRRAGLVSAWRPSPSIKPTAAAAAAPTTSRPPAKTSTGKPRRDFVGTYPTSSSPHTASFPEAERTRKHQEFSVNKSNSAMHKHNWRRRDNSSLQVDLFRERNCKGSSNIMRGCGLD